MQSDIEHTIHAILYDNPESDLSADDLNTLNALPIADVIPIIQMIYATETARNIIGKTYDAILGLQKLDKVQFFINFLNHKNSGRRATCCYTLGNYSDPRAIAALCTVLRSDPDPTIRYIAATALINNGDSTALAALAYARDHDFEEDFEGVPVSRMAGIALERIQKRLTMTGE